MVRRAQTREDIVAAAIAAWLEHGYQASSLDQVASRCGIAKTTILYHFDTKENLLREITEPLLADLEGALQAMPVVSEPTREQQRTYVEALVQVVLDHRREATLMQRFTTHSTVLGIGPRLYTIVEDWVRLLAGAQEGTDPLRRLHAAACYHAITATVTSRLDLRLESPAERQALINIAMAVLAAE